MYLPLSRGRTIKISEALHRRGKMLPVLIIAILLLGVGFLVSNILIADQQARIHITPMDVVEIIQREGYQVIDITEYDEPKNLGIIGDVDYYISSWIQLPSATTGE